MSLEPVRVLKEGMSLLPTHSSLHVPETVYDFYTCKRHTFSDSSTLP